MATIEPGATLSLQHLSKAELSERMRASLPTFALDRDPYVVVEGEGGRFVQLYKYGEDEYRVEHSNDDPNAPTLAAPEPMTLDETVRAFERFADGEWPPFEGGINDTWTSEEALEASTETPGTPVAMPPNQPLSRMPMWGWVALFALVALLAFWFSR